MQEPPYILDGALLIYYAVVFGIYAGNQAWQEGIFTYFNISLHGWVTLVMVVSMAPLAQHAIHAAQCTPVFELCGQLLLHPLSSNPAGLLMAAPYQELRHTITPPPPPLATTQLTQSFRFPWALQNAREAAPSVAWSSPTFMSVVDQVSAAWAFSQALTTGLCAVSAHLASALT